MIAIYILMALLITAGLFSLFNIKVRDVFASLFAPLDRKEEQRRRIDRLTGREPKRLRRMVINARAMLKSSNMSDKWESYKMSAIFFGILGVVIGLGMDNVFAAVVLAPTLALVPFAAIRLQASASSKRIMGGLSTSLGVITNQYIQTADIISSVKTRLSNIPQPLQNIFAEFLNTVEYINPDVQAAIYAMRDKLNNRYWRQWCDNLASCQIDNGLRITLNSIVKDLAESYRMQEELNTAINSIFAYFAMELAILAGTPALIALVYPDYANVLFFTDAGKIIVAIVLLVVLLCVVQLAKINRPLEDD